MQNNRTEAVISYKAIGPDNSNKIRDIIQFIRKVSKDAHPIRQVYCERYWRSQIGRNLAAICICKENIPVAFITINLKNYTLAKILGTYRSSVFEFKHIFVDNSSGQFDSEISECLNAVIEKNFKSNGICKIYTHFPKLTDGTENSSNNFVAQYFKGYEKAVLPEYFPGTANTGDNSLEFYIHSNNNNTLNEILSLNPELPALHKTSFSRVGIMIGRLQSEIYSKQSLVELNNVSDQIRSQYLLLCNQNSAPLGLGIELEKAGYSKCAEVRNLLKDGVAVYTKTTRNDSDAVKKDFIYRAATR